MNLKHALLSLSLCLLLLAALAPAAPEPLLTIAPDGGGSLARLPVREVTVFKDGHALLTHAGTLPTDTAGNVRLEALPAPVLGTFWPYAAQEGAQLRSVSAARQRVRVERTALSLKELIEANPGAEVTVTEKEFEKNPPARYSGTLAGIPSRSAAELEATSAPGAPPALPQQSTCFLLKNLDGIRVVPLDRVAELTFRDGPRTQVASEEFRNLLELRLDWAGKTPAKTAAVGLSYMVRGIRWIPNYRVDLDGAGQARIKLQATLVNEIEDLNDVTVRLVIGVPTIAFKDMTDPIALEQVVAQLAQAGARRAGIDGNFYNGSNAFSNAIVTQAQVAYSPEPGQPGTPPTATVNLGPEIPSAGKTEEWFIFTVEHVTLKKGQTMVMPVAEFALGYKDVYALEVPLAPPPEVMRNGSDGRQAAMAAALASPKVKHMVRLANSSAYPLTTAPALLLRGGQLLSQGLMTYAAPGGTSDLELGTAVDIAVKIEDRETGRTPNALNWNGNSMTRVDLAGSIVLTSYKNAPVEVEVNRYVLGKAVSAEADGRVEAIDVIGNPAGIQAGGETEWWGYYNWPWWWNHVNGRGRFTWHPTLEPRKAVELNYKWQYYWN